ncbi:DNA-binding XRE family transcriptional regulator [Sphingomonas sp. F9_3S_D5_B_2]
MHEQASDPPGGCRNLQRRCSVAVRKRIPQSALGDHLRVQFANNVKEVRRAKGMTQLELAMRAGLGRVFINQIERGHNSVTLETIGAIAAALEVRPASLISNRSPARHQHEEAVAQRRAAPENTRR